MSALFSTPARMALSLAALIAVGLALGLWVLGSLSSADTGESTSSQEILEAENSDAVDSDEQSIGVPESAAAGSSTSGGSTAEGSDEISASAETADGDGSGDGSGPEDSPRMPAPVRGEPVALAPPAEEPEAGYAPSFGPGAAEGERATPEDGYGGEGAPRDKTLTLSVEGMAQARDSTVQTASGSDTEALDAGPIHIEGTGFPWQEGANTYIAGHRIGYPGTGSDRVFWDLPSVEEGALVTLEDSEGKTYRYRVYANYKVEPSQTEVLEPEPGKDIVTLQTCTLPDYSERIIVQAERVGR